MKTIILILVSLTLNAADVTLRYVPGYSPVQPFTLKISNGMVEIIQKDGSEIIKSDTVKTSDFDGLLKLNEKYTQMVTDCATYDFKYVDGTVTKSVSIYAIDFVAENNASVAVIQKACDNIFKMIAVSATKGKIKDNFIFWAN